MKARTASVVLFGVAGAFHVSLSFSRMPPSLMDAPSPHLGNVSRLRAADMFPLHEFLEEQTEDRQTKSKK